MTGSAYQAMDVLGSCDSLYRVGVWGRDGTRMTGSAYNAMDVFEVCDSYSKGRGLGKGGQSGLLG